MFWIFLTLYVGISAGYQCLPKNDLDPTIDSCWTITPYPVLAKLDSSETQSADITIQNMKNEIIWPHLYLTTQNALRCMAFHPPCDSTNKTVPICIDSCTKFTDSIDTFESSVKQFCQKYFNPTISSNCIRLNGSDLLSLNSWVLILSLMLLMFSL